MALVTCSDCGREISDQVSACPHCGKTMTPSTPTRSAAIRSIGGKLKAVGALVIAFGVVATASGLWWGPALLLPGVALFMFGVTA